MNEDIVKKTQDSLGKIIGKKPPLTEKLLNRPPFRFLHDIITSVTRQTGFMKGLFSEKEGAAESITSKEEKVAFLQKAVEITAYASGTKLSVRPSKVVAGLEAEKTNEFLQAIAAAVSKSPDNEACVKKVLSGAGGGDSPSQGSRDSKSKDKDKESSKDDRERSADKRKRRSDKGEPPTKKLPLKSSNSSKDKENRESSAKKERDSSDKKEKEGSNRKEKEGADRKEKEGSDRKEREGSDRKDRDNRRNRDSSKDGGRRESSRNRESSRDRKNDPTEKRDEKRERSGRHRRKEEEPSKVNGVKDEPPTDERDSNPANEQSAGGDESQETDEEPTANRIPRPSSAKGSRRRHREDEGVQQEKSVNGRSMQEEEPAVPPQVEQSRRLARPSSARPAPPRVKRQEGVQDSLTERVDSARTQRVENVIIDNAQHSEEEDDDNFMVDEGAEEPLMTEREETIAPSAEEDGQHGGLVKKILESKKEYAQSEKQQQTKTKIDKSSVNDATRHKEREMVRKEVDRLRSSIQTLTRSANPLGKIMDYVQEDIHSMQKERDVWRSENRKLGDQIKREMSVTDGSIEPLRVTLAELEQATSDQLDLIAAVKHTIIDNDEKITKMLSSVSRT